MDRGCVILNPVAGDGRVAEEIRRMCARRENLSLSETTGSDQAEWLTREAVGRGCRTVVVAGGDGTLSEVINGVDEVLGEVRVGILPAGSANDFSKSLDLPRDIETAMAVIDAGLTRPIDLIRANYARPRLLLNAATGGLSTDLDAHMDPELKARWRGLAYVRAALAAVPGARTYQVRADVDGERLELESTGILVANGQFAGGLRLAPSACPGDSLLDFAIVTARGLSEKLRLAGQLAVGTHLDSEHVLVRRARRVRVESEPPMGLNSDGEPTGATPVTFEIIPAAIQLFVPAAQSGDRGP